MSSADFWQTVGRRGNHLSGAEGESRGAPVVVLPCSPRNSAVCKEPWDGQIDCVVQWKHLKRTERPFKYLSQSLHDTEPAHEPTHLKYIAVECPALLLLPDFKDYQFALRIDYDVLKWLLNLRDSTGNVAGWRLLLLDFKLKATHHIATELQPLTCCRS